MNIVLFLGSDVFFNINQDSLQSLLESLMFQKRLLEKKKRKLNKQDDERITGKILEILTITS